MVRVEFMNKKTFALISLLLFGALFSTVAYAFDVSIDRVRVNGNVVAESKSNLINDADVFSIITEFTAVETLQKGHVEAVLRGRESGDVIANATGTFDLAKNQSSMAALTLTLIDSLKRETEFDLTVKIVDVEGSSRQKSYTIKTERTRLRGALDVSIDRVRINGNVVATSRTNFIDESDDFDVLVEFTALEDLEDARVEAVLKDLLSGDVVADTSSNFDLSEDTSSSRLLRLELIDRLKKSNSFELTIKLTDVEGDSVQQLYRIRMEDGNGAVGRALDVSIDSVEIGSKVIAENENNFVIIGEGKKELDLRVSLTALENIENARISAVLAFENGDVVADTTANFDMVENENAVKKLELPLIAKFEQNNFKLRVKVIDAEGDSEEKVYGLRISQKKSPFVISSISLNPENTVEAGKALVVGLSFKNSGVMPLDGINAKVSIPELGVSSTKFVGSAKNSKFPEAREEFVLKISDNAPTGTYTLKSEIFSQFGGESETKEIPVSILGKSEQTRQLVNDKLVIKVPILKQDMRNDGSEAIYQLMLTNEGIDANTYTLLFDGDWANLRLAESNVFVIKPRESKTINIYASTNEDVTGEHIFLAIIKKDDNVLKQIPFKANVVETFAGDGLTAKVRDILEILLIGFVVVLLAVGLFFGIKKLMQGNDKGVSEEIPDEAEGEVYY